MLLVHVSQQVGLGCGLVIAKLTPEPEKGKEVFRCCNVDEVYSHHAFVFVLVVNFQSILGGKIFSANVARNPFPGMF